MISHKSNLTSVIAKILEIVYKSLFTKLYFIYIPFNYLYRYPSTLTFYIYKSGGFTIVMTYILSLASTVVACYLSPLPTSDVVSNGNSI